MMTTKYSPSNNTFYPSFLIAEYITAGTLPSDAVDVSNEIYSDFTGEPPAGMYRVAGSDGLPAWSELITGR